MIEKLLWNLFLNTGDINYYLNYKDIKVEDENNLEETYIGEKELLLR